MCNIYSEIIFCCCCLFELIVVDVWIEDSMFEIEDPSIHDVY